MNSQEMMSLQQDSNAIIRRMLANKVYGGRLKKDAEYREWLESEGKKDTKKTWDYYRRIVDPEYIYPKPKPKKKADGRVYKKPCKEYKRDYDRYVCKNGNSIGYMKKANKKSCLEFARKKYMADPSKFLDYLDKKNTKYMSIPKIEKDIVNSDLPQKTKKALEMVLPKLKNMPLLLEYKPDISRQLMADNLNSLEKQAIKEAIIRNQSAPKESVLPKKKKRLTRPAVGKLLKKQLGRKAYPYEIEDYMKEQNGGCMVGGYLYDTPYNSLEDELEQDRAIRRNIDDMVLARGASYGGRMRRRGGAKKGVVPKHLKAWLAHVKKVRAMNKNKNKTYKEILIEAKKTF